MFRCLWGHSLTLTHWFAQSVTTRMFSAPKTRISRSFGGHASSRNFAEIVLTLTGVLIRTTTPWPEGKVVERCLLGGRGGGTLFLTAVCWSGFTSGSALTTTSPKFSLGTKGTNSRWTCFRLDNKVFIFFVSTLRMSVSRTDDKPWMTSASELPASLDSVSSSRCLHAAICWSAVSKRLVTPPYMVWNRWASSSTYSVSRRRTAVTASWDAFLMALSASARCCSRSLMALRTTACKLEPSL